MQKVRVSTALYSTMILLAEGDACDILFCFQALCYLRRMIDATLYMNQPFDRLSNGSCVASILRCCALFWVLRLRSFDVDGTVLALGCCTGCLMSYFPIVDSTKTTATAAALTKTPTKTTITTALICSHTYGFGVGHSLFVPICSCQLSCHRKLQRVPMRTDKRVLILNSEER
jgi:hypothetical protein